jgi:peptidyl-prolyl cis-trans isomerase SurA
MTDLKFLLLLPFLITGLLGMMQSPARAQLRLSNDINNAPRVNAIPALAAPVPSAATTSGDLREVDYIVALVNSEPITRNEVLPKLNLLQTQWAQQGVRPPSHDAAFKGVLDQMINERIMLQLAKETGVRISDDQLDEALLNIARQNQLSSLQEFERRYTASNGNWNQYREDIRKEIAISQVKEREVDNRVRVSELDLDQAEREQQITSKASNDINLAQVLLAMPEGADAGVADTLQQKAKQIAARARSGEDFAKLALEFSNASDKANGGVMGLKPVERYPSLFAEEVRTLAVGAVSEPVRSGAGWHILKVLDRKETRLSSITQTRVRHILLNLKSDFDEGQAVRRANALRNQIELKQNDFASLAREYSADGSAAQGGELGWASPGLFVPEFEHVVNNLPIGKVSDPVVSRFGVHLIEVLERREVTLSAREQRAQLTDILRERKAVEAYKLWVAEIRQRAFVEFRNQTASN